MSDDEGYEVEGPELAEDDPMRAFLPQAFGKKSKEADVAAQIGRTKRAVEKAPAAAKSSEGHGDGQRRMAQEPASKDYGSDDDDDSDQSDDDEYPVSHELVLKTHGRAVTTTAVDPSGGRSRDPRRPQIPMVTPFMKSQPDEKHINESISLSSMRDEDPREALLKYAELAKKD